MTLATLDYITLAVFVAAGIILLAIGASSATELLHKWRTKRDGDKKMVELMRKWRDHE